MQRKRRDRLLRRRAGPHHLTGDILHRNRVGGHNPARFPDQHSPGAVHDGHTAQDGPDTLGGRFVPQFAQPAGQQTAARLLLRQVDLLWRRRIIEYLMIRAVRP